LLYRWIVFIELLFILSLLLIQFSFFFRLMKTINKMIPPRNNIANNTPIEINTPSNQTVLLKQMKVINFLMRQKSFLFVVL
jgi:hypothetical protein